MEDELKAGGLKRAHTLWTSPAERACDFQDTDKAQCWRKLRVEMALQAGPGKTRTSRSRSLPQMKKSISNPPCLS